MNTLTELEALERMLLDERNALRDNKLDVLESILPRKQRALRRITDGLGAVRVPGAEGGDSRVAVRSDLASDERALIHQQLERCLKLNEGNGAILRVRHSLNHRLLGILLGNKNDSAVYGKTGGMRARSTKRLFGQI